MNIDATRLTNKQLKGLTALLTEKTFEQAAEKAGVNRVTLYRWMANLDFKEALLQARAECVNQAISRLQHITAKAVDVMYDILVDQQSPAATRVTAARSVLELAIKTFEMQNLEHRLSKLEQVLAIVE